MEKKLVANRENFCHYYIETGNATDAYRKAYPNSIGWKDGVVSKRAFELLRNPSVASRVNELQADILKKSDMKKEDALRFLTNVVNVDPIDLQLKSKDTFIVRSLDDIPKPVRCCLQSIKKNLVQKKESSLLEMKIRHGIQRTSPMLHPID